MRATREPNDQPIDSPHQDDYGLDPFAQALAESLRTLEKPVGTVVALTGAWGSGKTSAANLVLHHLRPDTDARRIVSVRFESWRYHGELAVATAFIRDLSAALSPSLGKRVRKALPKVGARVLGAGSVIGSAVDLAGGAGAGALTSSALAWLGGLFGTEDTVEELLNKLSEELESQATKFLVIIDDIDRLTPEEALTIFRLVKSIGRLPNVMYLLLYERQVIESVVALTYPSEGPHFLEKIVQAVFELPEPLPSDLRERLLNQLSAIVGEVEEARAVDFMNVFFDAVVPVIRTPRDVARLVNSLASTWPAVAGEVDIGDYVALEAYRLLRPGLYRSIRQSKTLLCGHGGSEGSAPPLQGEDYDRLLLTSVEAEEHQGYRVALMRLFPRLESAWSNLLHGSHENAEWARRRRVCSEVHFDTYFRFAPSEDVLPRQELEAVIASCGDREALAQELRTAVGVSRRSGGTKAALILEELQLHADRVPREDVEPLLGAVFATADDLLVEADQMRGILAVGDNFLRIHWLIRGLTLRRFTIEERSAMLIDAARNATICWLADFADSAKAQYRQQDSEPPKPAHECLVAEDDLDDLDELLLNRIRDAASDGSLAKQSRLKHLLYRWSDLAGEAEPKAWTASLMDTTEGLECLAKQCVTEGWRQGLGLTGLADRVAHRSIFAQVDLIDSVMDAGQFRHKLELTEAADDCPEAIKTLLDAWRQQDEPDTQT